jgi:hypothetical protein
VRVYLPSTVGRLRVALEADGVEAPVAYAVTSALREWYAEGDVDELEYAASTAAGRASLRLLAEDGDEPRRVVLAAEVPDADVRPAPDVDRAAVRLAAAVPWRQVESALVDDGAAAADVRRAVDALAAGPSVRTGDDDLDFTLDSVEDHELGWWAVQELPTLVRP